MDFGFELCAGDVPRGDLAPLVLSGFGQHAWLNFTT